MSTHHNDELTPLYREKARELLVNLGIPLNDLDFQGVGEIERTQHGAHVPIRIFIYNHETGT